jgi:hypothetical protein
MLAKGNHVYNQIYNLAYLNISVFTTLELLKVIRRLRSACLLCNWVRTAETVCWYVYVVHKCWRDWDASYICEALYVYHLNKVRFVWFESWLGECVCVSITLCCGVQRNKLVGYLIWRRQRKVERNVYERQLQSRPHVKLSNMTF